MDTIQKINQVLDRIQQYKTTVDKNIIQVDNKFALTADEIIKKKIPLNVLGCTGTAKLFVHYANEVDLECEVVFTANKNDLKDKNSRINGHQLISVKLEDGKEFIFDPREAELKQINLDSFFHTNIPHIFTGKIAGKDIEQINSVEKIEEIYLTGYKNQLMQKGTKNLQNKNISFDLNERD